MRNKPLLVIGAGGHSAVLLAELISQGRDIIGIVSPEPPARQAFQDFKIYSSDEEILSTYNPLEVSLVNGVGSLPGHHRRETLFKRFVEQGFIFETIIARSAIVSEDVVLGHGVQVMAGAIIQSGVVVSDNTIINTGAIVDHDCAIGRHNHLAPGMVFSGGVRTGDNVHVGTGSCVIHGISLGGHSVVGAGVSIVHDVPEKQTVVPAKVRYITS